MSNLCCEWTDDCMHIRLTAGTTNLLTMDLLMELSDAIADAQIRSRGLLLCGGDKFFSNGVDLDWALSQSSEQIRAMFLELGKCILQLMESPLPVIGAIKGHAIGGALALLLACDYRFGSKGRVLVGKPEILLGVPNPYYGDQIFRFVAGDFIASDLIYTGKLVSAEDAHKMQFMHGVDSKKSVEGKALKKLELLLELAPEAFAESKRMRNGAFCADVREQMSSRVARQVEIWNSADAQSRLHAAAEQLSR